MEDVLQTFGGILIVLLFDQLIIHLWKYLLENIYLFLKKTQDNSHIGKFETFLKRGKIQKGH